jgi:hypothetical protein
MKFKIGDKVRATEDPEKVAAVGSVGDVGEVVGRSLSEPDLAVRVVWEEGPNMDVHDSGADVGGWAIWEDWLELVE